MFEENGNNNDPVDDIEEFSEESEEGQFERDGDFVNNVDPTNRPTQTIGQ